MSKNRNPEKWKNILRPRNNLRPRNDRTVSVAKDCNRQHPHLEGNMSRKQKKKIRMAQLKVLQHKFANKSKELQRSHAEINDSKNEKQTNENRQKEQVPAALVEEEDLQILGILGKWQDTPVALKHDLLLSGIRIRRHPIDEHIKSARSFLDRIFGENHVELMCIDVVEELMLVRSKLQLAVAVRVFNTAERHWRGSRLFIQTRAQIEMPTELLVANTIALDHLRSIKSTTKLPKISARVTVQDD